MLCPFYQLLHLAEIKSIVLLVTQMLLLLILSITTPFLKVGVIPIAVIFYFIYRAQRSFAHGVPNQVSTDEKLIALLGTQGSASSKPLAGKVAVVTGGNCGIGFENVRSLARFGAAVVLACRSAPKAHEAITAIQREISDAKISFVPLDLADIKSIDAFPPLAAKAVKEILGGTSTEFKIDILINNAGMYSQKRQRSHYGCELLLATNHLGPMRLTTLLLPAVRRGGANGNGGRIVMLSSLAHAFCPLDLSQQPKSIVNLLEKSVASNSPTDNYYGLSKMCNLMYARWLAAEEQKVAKQSGKDKGVTVVAVHPGFVLTNVFREVPSMNSIIVRKLFTVIMKSCDEGARTSLYCAVAPDVQNGGYYCDCALSEATAVQFGQHQSEEAKNMIDWSWKAMPKLSSDTE